MPDSAPKAGLQTKKWYCPGKHRWCDATVLDRIVAMSEHHDTVTFPTEQLESFSTRVFEFFDVPSDDAKLAASVLASSDLRGIDSHGISRLPIYAKYLADGTINPCPQVTIVRESLSTATVDGDNGLGLIVGPRANAIAMSKAELSF